ncbi:MAG: hypothetical protein H6R07_3134 [Proteobacteria bacterium]|nr:hypothetical protein [Pseudomonadota bacterium]
MYPPYGAAPGFSIRNWAAWAPGLESRQDWLDWRADPRLPVGDGAPAAACLPPLLRRRAMRLGRMALECLAAVSCDVPADTPVVFASRHGEALRSQGLIRELLDEESVSPQSFSLSVHNATLGLYTIANGCHANVTALAGSNATASALLTEAMGLLADGLASVLIIACDEMLPDCYASYADEPQAPFAWAAELVASDEFTPSIQPAVPASRNLPELLDLFRFLIDPQQPVWCASSGALHWQRAGGSC